MGRKNGEKTGFVHCHSQGGNQVWLNKVFQSIPPYFFPLLIFTRTNFHSTPIHIKI